MADLTDVLGDVTNDAAWVIDSTRPYVARVRIQGTAPILFHRWSNEAVEAKANAAKGSTAKKSDDVESYVWRLPNRNIGLPGEYLRQAIVEAGRYRQDPRSPRRMARELLKAAVSSLTELADLGTPDWDYLDRRRVMVQRSAITRSRPAMHPGWSAEVDLMVTLSQYVTPTMLLELLGQAGMLVGVGDFRPTFGRFAVTGFEGLQS